MCLCVRESMRTSNSQPFFSAPSLDDENMTMAGIFGMLVLDATVLAIVGMIGIGVVLCSAVLLLCISFFYSLSLLAQT